MKHLLDIRPVDLPARAVHRIADGKGAQITTLRGVVWVTQADDPRDIILARGQSFIIDRRGLTVVYALREASILVGPAGHVSAVDFEQSPRRDRAA